MKSAPFQEKRWEKRIGVIDRISEEIRESEAQLGQAMKTKESSMRVCDEIAAKQQDRREAERGPGDEHMEEYIDALEMIQMNLQKATSLQKELQGLVSKAEDADHYNHIMKAIQ